MDIKIKISPSKVTEISQKIKFTITNLKTNEVIRFVTPLHFDTPGGYWVTARCFQLPNGERIPRKNLCNVIGYDIGGDFPYCESINDINKILNYIRLYGEI